MANISIWQLAEYIGDRKRCAIEGQAVLDAGHLITCGVVDESEKTDEVTIKALCVRSTSVQEAPHELKAVIGKDAFAVQCSCKAGLSETCKHCIALLTHIHKTSVAHIPRLSCTDIAQKWGRTQAANVCPPVPVEDLCHVGRPAHGEKPASGGGYLDTLLAAAPTSALAVHRRRAALQSGNQLATQGGTAVATVPTVVSAAVRSVVQQAGNLSGGQHCPNVLEQGFFEKHVQKSESECAEICAATVGQNGAGWDQERRLRITASSSYQWYTYNGSDWKGKVERFYKNRDAFKGNAATRHGHAFEAEAIKMYEEFSGLGVCKVGLVIPTNVPWLGCSPDGIVFDGLVPAKLVEVKCPAKLAADVGIWEAMSGKVLSFIECDGENVRLKPRHPYYGQVQLSMAILGVRHCDFLVYGSARDEMFIVNVPRDDRFVESMLLKLESVYFSHILPFLVRTLG